MKRIFLSWYPILVQILCFIVWATRSLNRFSAPQTVVNPRTLAWSILRLNKKTDTSERDRHCSLWTWFISINVSYWISCRKKDNPKNGLLLYTNNFRLHDISNFIDLLPKYPKIPLRIFSGSRYSIFQSITIF